MLKAPQGDVGEDLLTKLEETEEAKFIQVPLNSFQGLVLYDGMDVTISVKVSISAFEYRILARKIKPNLIKTLSGFIKYKEYIDPKPLKLPEDVEIRVIEVFYKLSFNEIFVRCDIENDLISSATSRQEMVANGNILIKQLKSLGFSIFKSDKYGDLFEE